jgi:hypothetical protein
MSGSPHRLLSGVDTVEIAHGRILRRGMVLLCGCGNFQIKQRLA